MAESIDWHRLLWDLLQRGVSIRSLAAELDLPATTVRGYMCGSHPPHWKGEILIATWERCTGGQREELKTAPVDASKHRVMSERSAVLSSQGVIDSLLQLDLAWYGATDGAEAAAEEAAWSVRFRVGIAFVPAEDGDQPTAFVVQDERTAALVARSPKFIRWAGDWVTLGARSKEPA